MPERMFATLSSIRRPRRTILCRNHRILSASCCMAYVCGVRRRTLDAFARLTDGISDKMSSCSVSENMLAEHMVSVPVSPQSVRESAPGTRGFSKPFQPIECLLWPVTALPLESRVIDTNVDAAIPLCMSPSSHDSNPPCDLTHEHELLKPKLSHRSLHLPSRRTPPRA